MINSHNPQQIAESKDILDCIPSFEDIDDYALYCAFDDDDDDEIEAEAVSRQTNKPCASCPRNSTKLANLTSRRGTGELNLAQSFNELAAINRALPSVLALFMNMGE